VEKKILYKKISFFDLKKEIQKIDDELDKLIKKK